jgi:hypothetical protein
VLLGAIYLPAKKGLKMLRSLKAVKGYSVQATDGKIGSVSDFYFDDKEWRVRYVVVDTGRWLPGRQVLLSPAACLSADWDHRELPVSLTTEQVKNSPGLETHQPVSRKYEAELSKYYRWPMYWGASPEVSAWMPPPAATSPDAMQAQGQPLENEGESNLRSSDEIVGYGILALDGEIGHVEDLIADDEMWSIRYFVVDTRNWIPGRKVLVSPEWIRRISWANRDVTVDLTEQQVRDSPEFDSTAPVNEEYERRLYDFYGRPKYWVER